MVHTLRASFNQPLVDLGGKPERPGERFSLSLRAGEDASTDDNPYQKVLRIQNSHRQPTPFSFGFTVDFAMKTNVHRHNLAHASITVYHELSFQRVELFRADWDQLDALDLESHHAQPHWHFVQNPSAIERIVRLLLAPPTNAVTDFRPDSTEIFSGSADCGKFHFAMTSLWEPKETPPYRKRIFDANSFPRWFESLTIYIARQIEYLMSLMPSQAGIEIKEFSGN